VVGGGVRPWANCACGEGLCALGEAAGDAPGPGVGGGVATTRAAVGGGVPVGGRWNGFDGVATAMQGALLSAAWAEGGEPGQVPFMLCVLLGGECGPCCCC